MKRYVVRLTDAERKLCDETVDRLSGKSQKARRARILRQVDVAGPGWTDRAVAEAFHCRVETVENVRKRCVLEGFERALEGKQRPAGSVPKLLDGRQEAAVIALRLGPAPPGYAKWSLRLLAQHSVELGIADSLSHETVRQTLKKRHCRSQAAVLGDPAGGRRGVRGGDGAGATDLRATVRGESSSPVHG